MNITKELNKILEDYESDYLRLVNLNPGSRDEYFIDKIKKLIEKCK